MPVVLSARALAHAARAGRRVETRYRIPLATQGKLVQESLTVYRDNTRRIAWIIAAEAAAHAAHAVWKAEQAARQAALEARYATAPAGDPMEESWRQWCAMGED